MNFQNLIRTLQDYWGARNCVLLQPFDNEVGAGTFAPGTFFGVLGSSPWRTGYVQPSRRPADGRYGENPNRLYQHHQYQVILKPAPTEIQNIYLESLFALGIKPQEHDLRFVEDDWESPTLGASGLGWEVWCDGMEITQFTYFQQMGGFELDPIPVELTYGLERIAMFLQGVDNVFDLIWTDGVTYQEVRKRYEYELSCFNFEHAPIDQYRQWFNEYEAQALSLAKVGLVYPAYELTLKCSHTFNILDARGAVSVSERANYIARVRKMAKTCARLYLKGLQGEEQ